MGLTLMMHLKNGAMIFRIRFDKATFKWAGIVRMVVRLQDFTEIYPGKRCQSGMNYINLLITGRDDSL